MSKPNPHSPLEDAADCGTRPQADDAASESQEPTTTAEPTLEEQLQQAIAEKCENWDRFLRSQAELENYRKRTQRERDEERRYAALPVVRDLIGVLDNLQRAVDACRQTSPEADSPAGGLLQGVEMVLAQTEEVLGRHGVKTIAALGQPFDPQYHEALQQVPTDEHPPMTVINEYERGYSLHDRVVRPSKVIVSVAPPQE
ncbi:MAG: nucleotide exchange factor GrpE [Planctomycetaceae bacterium]|nr:nucleotide exchange factor GrpE [Planctomycetaceae bacterium]